MSRSSDPTEDFVTQIEDLTRYLKTMQLPISDEERLVLAALYSQLMEMLEGTDSPCPTCGSTDGFHTEDACLDPS